VAAVERCALDGANTFPLIKALRRKQQCTKNDDLTLAKVLLAFFMSKCNYQDFEINT